MIILFTIACIFTKCSIAHIFKFRVPVLTWWITSGVKTVLFYNYAHWLWTSQIPFQMWIQLPLEYWNSSETSVLFYCHFISTEWQMWRHEHKHVTPKIMSNIRCKTSIKIDNIKSSSSRTKIYWPKKCKISNVLMSSNSTMTIDEHVTLSRYVDVEHPVFLFIWGRIKAEFCL